MTRNPTWVQQDYQFYNDNGVQGSATTKGAINNSVNITQGTKFRLRVNFGDTNNATQNNTRSVNLQLNINGGGWNDVTGATGISYTTSAFVSDGNNDPNERLSNIVGTSFTGAWEEFDTNNTTTSQTWADNYTEYEFCLLENGVTAGQSVQFRLLTSSDETPAITNTPTITVVAAVSWSGYSFDVTI